MLVYLYIVSVDNYDVMLFNLLTMAVLYVCHIDDIIKHDLQSFSHLQLSSTKCDYL